MESKLEELLTRDCPETEAEPVSPIAEDIEEDSAATSLQGLILLISEINDEIEKAKLHVTMHTVQREEAKKLIGEAEADHEEKKPLCESTVGLTMDMSQNGTVPLLSGDQCGDFYYMSPLTQLIFGIVNNAQRFMNTYIWSEGTAARGADNIVSCLYWDLERRKIMT